MTDAYPAAQTSMTELIKRELYLILQRGMEIETQKYATGWLVKRGPLQDDPEAYQINITIYSNDPDREGIWTHERITQWGEGIESWDWEGVVFPGYEIAGRGHSSQGWLRRFTVRLTIFLGETTLDRDERERIAELVLGAAEVALLSDTGDMATLADCYGETMFDAWNPLRRTELIGGGESGIFHGKMWLEYRTQKEQTLS